MDNFDHLVTDPEVRLGDVEKFIAGDAGLALFRERYVVLVTSGSTGLKGLFLYNPAEWVTVLANAIRAIAWTNPRRSQKGPVRSATIASTTPRDYSARVAASFQNRWLLQLDAAQSLDYLVGRLNDWQPQIIWGFPSVLRQLAEEQIAGRLRLSPERITTGGEVLREDTRRRIEEAWGQSPHNSYAATEYAPIAAECSHRRMHLEKTALLSKSSTTAAVLCRWVFVATGFCSPFSITGRNH